MSRPATNCKSSKDLNRLNYHVKDSAVIMTRLGGHSLCTWISTVEKDSPTPRPFARNLRRHIDAVPQRPDLPCRSGPVGATNRIKMIRRQVSAEPTLSSSGNENC
ncbi:hypothetical protein JMUB6875_48110 [Nocardia sp. JMUB6875]